VLLLWWSRVGLIAGPFFFGPDMLKHRDVELSGKDAGRRVRLCELPAMIADRHARALLHRLDEDPDGGIAALAFRHIKRASPLDEGRALLPFIEGLVRDDEHRSHSLDLARDIKDWRNIERLQHAALLLHVDFLIGRETFEVPVRMQAEGILAGAGEYRASFCSPQIAAIIDSGKASYRELETVLSTEDVFNIVEILNVSAVRDWHATRNENQ